MKLKLFFLISFLSITLADPLHAIEMSADELRLVYDHANAQWHHKDHARPNGFSTIFRDLAPEHWPILPESYEWRVLPDGTTDLFCHTSALPHTMEFVTYGSQTPDKYSFLSRWDGVTYHSFAYTRNPPLQNEALRAKYPINAKGFVFNGHTYVRGHSLDFADTWGPNNDTIYAEAINPAISTLDPRQFIPEPPRSHWGLCLRNSYVHDIRNRGGTYAQYNYYDRNPNKTADGTAIPRGIFFVAQARGASPLKSYHVPWDHPIHNAHADGTDWRVRLNPLASPDSFFPSPFVHDMRRPLANRMLDLPILEPFSETSLAPIPLFRINKAADHEIRNAVGKVHLCNNLIVTAAPVAETESWLTRLIDHTAFVADLDCRAPMFPTVPTTRLLQRIAVAAELDRDDQLHDHLRQLWQEQQDPAIEHVEQAPLALRRHVIVEKPVIDMNDHVRVKATTYTQIINTLLLHKGIRILNLHTKRAQSIAERIRAAFPTLAERKALSIEYTIPDGKCFNFQAEFSNIGIAAKRVWV